MTEIAKRLHQALAKVVRCKQRPIKKHPVVENPFSWIKLNERQEYCAPLIVSVTKKKSYSRELAP
ncbi:hypothetical protein NT239_05820 [Chitinibacter sp. SCUT-21]|uniref:hypothetical protein n=1 Tax=Chitinibacter sp. SCUT-21 TaxID=2970891 RepID=UPI0035A5B43B